MGIQSHRRLKVEEWHGYLECGKCWGIRRPLTTPPDLGEEICPDCKGDYGIDWIRPLEDYDEDF